MPKKQEKQQAEKKIKEFFSNIESKTPQEIKKIKRLAMHYNIKLKEKRKLFCKKCFAPFTAKTKIRIKNKLKVVTCKNCGFVSRWKANAPAELLGKVSCPIFSLKQL